MEKGKQIKAGWTRNGRVPRVELKLKVSSVRGSKEYRDVGGDNQKVLLVENDSE